MGQTRRSSTTRTYLSIWRQFKKFVIRLDVKPKTWEDKVTLFVGYKIKQEMQSSTLKSYVSAIKKTLIEDGYDWDDKKILLGSLRKACKIVNDKVHVRLPIQCSLLEMLLFEIQRIFRDKGQLFLQTLYQALFAISYYGLMRVGEVTLSDHVVKAKDIHEADGKDKILIILYSSKTHTTRMRPQKIKITSNQSEKSGHYAKRYFCPDSLVRKFLHLRGNYDYDSDKFFVFKDGTPVTAKHARNMLKLTLNNLGLNAKFYGMHSFRVGRTTDLIKYNYSFEEVKCMGR